MIFRRLILPPCTGCGWQTMWQPGGEGVNMSRDGGHLASRVWMVNSFLSGCDSLSSCSSCLLEMFSLGLGDGRRRCVSVEWSGGSIETSSSAKLLWILQTMTGSIRHHTDSVWGATQTAEVCLKEARLGGRILWHFCTELLEILFTPRLEPRNLCFFTQKKVSHQKFLSIPP